MEIKTILVPVDFSECSLEVSRAAAELAAKLGARLVYLHIVDAPPGISLEAHIRAEGGGTEQVTVREYLHRDARRHLGAYREIARRAGVEATEVLHEGPPARGILDAAGEQGADLIFMGTHGRRGIARAVLGSVAEEVLRHARVPVLTVRSEHRPTCEARSCAWCASGVSEAHERVLAELEG